MPEQQGTYAKPRLDLGVALKEFIDKQDDFVGTKMLPIFETMKKSANFPAITRESITREAEVKRAPRGNYNRDTFATKDVLFACQEYGLEGVLDDSERNLYKSDFDAELHTSQIIQRRLLLAQEKRVSSACFNTTTFTGADLYTDNSGNPWSAVGTDVITQVRTAREKVRKNCGMEPNAIVFSKTNWDSLLANTGIKSAIQYVARLTEAEIANALADILGIQKILVGKGILNSAKEGKPFSGSDVWTANYALVAVVPSEGQNLSDPALGRTFLWIEDSPENVTVEEYREEGVRGDVFRVRHNVQELIIDPYFGHLMKVR